MNSVTSVACPVCGAQFTKETYSDAQFSNCFHCRKLEAHVAIALNDAIQRNVAEQIKIRPCNSPTLQCSEEEAEKSFFLAASHWKVLPDSTYLALTLQMKRDGLDRRNLLNLKREIEDLIEETN